MSPRNFFVTLLFSLEDKKNRKKYAAHFSEILDPPLVHVLVVADGPGAGLKGGGSEYFQTALILNQHAFINI